MLSSFEERIIMSSARLPTGENNNRILLFQVLLRIYSNKSVRIAEPLAYCTSSTISFGFEGGNKSSSFSLRTWLKTEKDPLGV
jgi:hypothetical protein